MVRLTLALLLVTFPASFAATCDSCKTTYDAAVTDSGATPETKCTAAGVYGKCLFTASGDGCDTLTTKVGKINSDAAALSSSACSMTATCSCQLTYLAADVSSSTAKCTAVTALNTCATSQSDAGCGDETNPNVKTAISGLVKACTVTIPASVAATCDSCKTTYDAAVAVSPATAQQKCNAASEYGKCLFTATGTGCETLTTKVTTLNTDVTTLTAAVCSMTATCSCQLTYLAADVSTTTAKCAAVTALNTCATSQSDAGCGDETNPNVKTAISGLVTACSGASVVQFTVLSVLAIIAGVFFGN